MGLLRFLQWLVVLGVIGAWIPPVAHAEILHGVEPFDSLGDIRRKYPNARFERVRAAWVKEDEAFFSMTGQGFPGKLYLAFWDSRSFVRFLAAQIQEKSPDARSDSEKRSLTEMENIIRASDDVSLTISWVRWVPDFPIPMERYRSRYGAPSRCDYNESDMSRYCEWESRALIVSLSDDGRNVLSVETPFTRREQQSAWIKRNPGTPLPPWLQGVTPAKPAPSRPAAR